MVYDINGNLLENYDISKGKLVENVREVFHPAIESVEEVGHYEIIAEYSATGGRDVKWIVDTPGVDGSDEYTEIVNIQTFIPYTESELAELELIENKPTIEQRINSIEEALLEIVIGSGLE